MVGPVFGTSRQSHKFLTTSDLYNFRYITARDFKFSGFTLSCCLRAAVPNLRSPLVVRGPLLGGLRARPPKKVEKSVLGEIKLLNICQMF